MPSQPPEERRCPGEKYAISESICQGRVARHYPKCKQCKWRQGAGGEANAPAEPPADLDAIFKAYDIRGMVDKEITKSVAWKVGYATAAHLLSLLPATARSRPEQQFIVVGHDMRPTSEGYAHEVAEGVRATGAGALLVGQIETPAIYYAIGSLKTLGGIQITASHNPVTYNGFKITGPGCAPVGMGSGLEKIKEIAAHLADTSPPPIGPVREQDISSGYLRHVRKFAGAIRPMKIVLDCSNGMASKWVPSLLREYNIGLESLNLERSGRFHHEPNSMKESALEEMKVRVRATEAALGACFDGDADRVAFVDEQGTTVPNDLVAALLVPGFLAKERGATIVYDLRSSWALKEEILAHGGVPRREKVGHSFIKATLRETNAPFGAELSGHSYYRDNFSCDSAVITLLKVLTVISAHPDEPLSTLVEPLRRYFTTGEINFEVDDKTGLMKQVAQAFSDAKVDFLDGVTIEYADWWVNVRPSNTEPLLRLTLEARSAQLRDEMLEKCIAILGEPSTH